MSLVEWIHIFGWLYSVWVIHVYSQYGGRVIHKGYQGSWQFLTFLNLCIQLVVSSLSILQIISSHTNMMSMQKHCKVLKETVQSSIGFPVCLIVSSFFWIIYAIDRELVYPKSLDDIIPYWTNHIFHTVILVKCLEFMLEDVKYPSRKYGLTLGLLFLASYFIWISYLYFKTGFWPYGFMHTFSVYMFALFILATAFYYTFLFCLGEFLNNFLHDTYEQCSEKNPKNHQKCNKVN